MRATWTSMSNIEHYKAKDITGLSLDRAQKLDSLLLKERDSIMELLNFNFVKLKCICSPEIKFLSDASYSPEEKDEKFESLAAFLTESLTEHIDRREILYDKAGAYGNQLFIGNNVAITANPEYGGYTKTFFSENKQVTDILIREYDSLFQRIRQSKFSRKLFGSFVEQNKLLLYENLLVLGRD